MLQQSTNMSLPIHEKKYLPLNTQVEDLEDDSDTTLTSPGQKSSHLKRRRKLPEQSNNKISITLTWLRWGFVVILQSIILILLLQNNQTTTSFLSKWSTDDTETGGDINGLYIPTKHKYTLLVPQESEFVPDMSSNDNRMEVRKNWDKLMPRMFPHDTQALYLKL
jgi:hypothetical protein